MSEIFQKPTTNIGKVIIERMANRIDIPIVPPDAALPYLDADKDQIILLQQEIINLLKEKIKRLEDDRDGK